MSRLAIIPARSGSKRIKHKNIKKFRKKPVINYSIELAINSKLFDEIYISTDKKLYLETVKKYKLKNSFLRPKKLSNDSTPLFDVIKYVVKKYEEDNIFFDEIFLISACNPLIKIDDILKGYKIFKKYNKKFPVMPVIKYPVPISWALNLKKDKLKPIQNKKLNISSQSLKNYYYDSGSFYIFPRKYINFKSLSDYSEKFIGFEISQFNSVDIDTIHDWKLAEAIYDYSHKK